MLGGNLKLKQKQIYQWRKGVGLPKLQGELLKKKRKRRRDKIYRVENSERNIICKKYKREKSIR